MVTLQSYTVVGVMFAIIFIVTGIAVWFDQRNER
ncbi:hypothetical protein EDF35_1823 [Rathayibacter sp. PhB151]|nr:hypothetical protein EDF35_1823 [Rathayibacter sp. PhB151]